MRRCRSFPPLRSGLNRRRRRRRRRKIFLTHFMRQAAAPSASAASAALAASVRGDLSIEESLKQKKFSNLRPIREFVSFSFARFLETCSIFCSAAAASEEKKIKNCNFETKKTLTEKNLLKDLIVPI